MQMKTLYIHPGWSKTGTSAIQRALHLNSNELKKKGILYPESVQWNDHSHHNFALSFNSNSGYESKFTPEEAIVMVENELAESCCHSMILSSELSPLYFQFEIFNNFVKENFDRVILIFTVRQQSELCLSLFNQLVKDPTVQYKGSLFHLFIRNIGWLDYNKKISEWEGYSKEVEVEVIPYGKDIVHNFLNIFKIEKFEEDRTSINKSVSNELLIAIQQHGKRFNKTHEYNQMIKKLSSLYSANESEYRAQGSLFSVVEQKAIDEHYADSNNLVAKKYLRSDTLFVGSDYQRVGFVPAVKFKL